jgi:hypothetical protein
MEKPEGLGSRNLVVPIAEFDWKDRFSALKHSGQIGRLFAGPRAAA